MSNGVPKQDIGVADLEFGRAWRTPAHHEPNVHLFQTAPRRWQKQRRIDQGVLQH